MDELGFAMAPAQGTALERSAAALDARAAERARATAAPTAAELARAARLGHACTGTGGQRARCWLEAVRRTRAAHRGVAGSAPRYDECLREGTSDEALRHNWVNVIEADLPRTFPEHLLFARRRPQGRGREEGGDDGRKEHDSTRDEGCCACQKQQRPGRDEGAPAPDSKPGRAPADADADGGHDSVGSYIPRLRRVLLAVAAAVPSASYLQGMNLLAGFLLCVYGGDEVAAFETMVHVVGGLLPSYFSAKLSGLVDDMALFPRLLAARSPELAEHLEAAGLDMVLLLPRWALSCFVGVLPTALTLRVWDALLLAGGDAPEGVGTDGARSVVLGTALAALEEMRSELMAADGLAEMAAIIRAPQLATVDAQAFLKSALGDADRPLQALLTPPPPPFDAVAQGPGGARAVLSPLSNSQMTRMRRASKARSKRKRDAEGDACTRGHPGGRGGVDAWGESLPGSPAAKAARRARAKVDEAIFTPISKFVRRVTGGTAAAAGGGARTGEARRCTRLAHSSSLPAGVGAPAGVCIEMQSTPSLRKALSLGAEVGEGSGEASARPHGHTPALGGGEADKENSPAPRVLFGAGCGTPRAAPLSPDWVGSPVESLCLGTPSRAAGTPRRPRQETQPSPVPLALRSPKLFSPSAMR